MDKENDDPNLRHCVPVTFAEEGPKNSAVNAGVIEASQCSSLTFETDESRDGNAFEQDGRLPDAIMDTSYSMNFSFESLTIEDSIITKPKALAIEDSTITKPKVAATPLGRNNSDHTESTSTRRGGLGALLRRPEKERTGNRWAAEIDFRIDINGKQIGMPCGTNTGRASEPQRSFTDSEITDPSGNASSASSGHNSFAEEPKFGNRKRPTRGFPVPFGTSSPDFGRQCPDVNLLDRLAHISRQNHEGSDDQHGVQLRSETDDRVPLTAMSLSPAKHFEFSFAAAQNQSHSLMSALSPVTHSPSGISPNMTSCSPWSVSPDVAMTKATRSHSMPLCRQGPGRNLALQSGWLTRPEKELVVPPCCHAGPPRTMSGVAAADTKGFKHTSGSVNAVPERCDAPERARTASDSGTSALAAQPAGFPQGPRLDRPVSVQKWRAKGSTFGNDISGSSSGNSLYERGEAWLTRKRIREQVLRHVKEEGEVGECTFAPAVAITAGTSRTPKPMNRDRAEELFQRQMCWRQKLEDRRESVREERRKTEEQELINLRQASSVRPSSVRRRSASCGTPRKAGEHGDGNEVLAGSNRNIDDVFAEFYARSCRWKRNRDERLGLMQDEDFVRQTAARGDVPPGAASAPGLSQSSTPSAGRFGKSSKGGQPIRARPGLTVSSTSLTACSSAPSTAEGSNEAASISAFRSGDSSHRTDDQFSIDKGEVFGHLLTLQRFLSTSAARLQPSSSACAVARDTQLRTQSNGRSAPLSQRSCSAGSSYRQYPKAHPVVPTVARSDVARVTADLVRGCGLNLRQDSPSGKPLAYSEISLAEGDLQSRNGKPAAYKWATGSGGLCVRSGNPRLGTKPPSPRPVSQGRLASPRPASSNPAAAVRSGSSPRPVSQGRLASPRPASSNPAAAVRLGSSPRTVAAASYSNRPSPRTVDITRVACTGNHSSRQASPRTSGIVRTSSLTTHGRSPRLATDASTGQSIRPPSPRLVSVSAALGARPFRYSCGSRFGFQESLGNLQSSYAAPTGYSRT